MRKIITGVAACALALGFVLVSCDDKASNPSTSNVPPRDKGQDLLATCGSPVVFKTIDHCPISSGSLSIVGSNLEATNFSATSGFQSEWTSATEWQRKSMVDFGSSGSGYVQTRAISSGVISAAMTMQQTGTNTFNLWADFTGGIGMSYRVELWSGSTLTGSQSGLSASDRIALTCTMMARAQQKKTAISDFKTSTQYWDLFYPRRVSEPVNPGACVWELRTLPGSTFPNVTLPNTNSYSNTIDKIVMIETTAPGAYPYHDFQEMETIGTISLMSLADESKL